MALNKQAVDQKAKEYFKLLWDTYGEALTNDIPRRIKAELQLQKKVAMVDENAPLNIIAAGERGDKFVIEGSYIGPTEHFLFRASLDEAGDVADLVTIQTWPFKSTVGQK